MFPDKARFQARKMQVCKPLLFPLPARTTLLAVSGRFGVEGLRQGFEADPGKSELQRPVNSKAADTSPVQEAGHCKYFLFLACLICYSHLLCRIPIFEILHRWCLLVICGVAVFQDAI